MTPNLRAVREQRGLTLTRFAQLVHVATSTASRWESGYRRPHPADVERIAAALSCSPTEVATWFRAQPPLSTETVRCGVVLRALRMRARLSRADLAARLGLSPATMAHWECDRRAVPLVRVPAVAAALEVTPAQLMAALTSGRSTTMVAPLPAQLRRRAGLTQRQVAAALRVSYGTISAWERGVRVPRWPDIRRLQRLYRCPLRDVARAVGAEPLTALDVERVVATPLAEVVAAARRWRGESLIVVAARVGVSWQTLRRWERGSTVPTVSQRRRLEWSLGIPAQLLDRCPGEDPLPPKGRRRVSSQN